MKIQNSFLPFLLSLLTVSCSPALDLSDSTKEISTDSPISVLKAFTEAKKAKDLETMKKSLSKGTLDTIAGVAEGNGKTVDEYLLPGNTTPLNRPEMPQTRNEKIDGDIATVVISRFPGDKWRKLTFVREDGFWKMDLNLYMNELYPNLKNDTTGPAPPPPSK
jgi:hypothetical protein